MNTIHNFLSLGAATTGSLTIPIPGAFLRGVCFVWDSDNWTWQTADRAFVELSLDGGFSLDSRQGDLQLLAAHSIGAGFGPVNFYIPFTYRLGKDKRPILTLRTTAWTGAQSVVYVDSIVYFD